MVSTPESDPYISSSSKDLASEDDGLSNESDSMMGELSTVHGNLWTFFRQWTLLSLCWPCKTGVCEGVADVHEVGTVCLPLDLWDGMVSIMKPYVWGLYDGQAIICFRLVNSPEHLVVAMWYVHICTMHWSHYLTYLNMYLCREYLGSSGSNHVIYSHMWYEFITLPKVLVHASV